MDLARKTSPPPSHLIVVVLSVDGALAGEHDARSQPVYKTSIMAFSPAVLPAAGTATQGTNAAERAGHP
jgi:hypothetical protein